MEKTFKLEFTSQKSRIRETPNLSTNANKSTDTINICALHKKEGTDATVGDGFSLNDGKFFQY